MARVYRKHRYLAQCLGMFLCTSLTLLPTVMFAGVFFNRGQASCPSCANGQCPMQQPATAAPTTAAPIPHFVPTNDPPAPVTPPVIPTPPPSAIVVPAEIEAAAQKCEANLLAVQAAQAKKANLATQIEALQKQLAAASDGSAEKQLADDYANFQKLTGQRYAPQAAK
jgi:hypothetical protein